MKAPKQVIYPMRYISPLLSGDDNAEERFEAGLRSLLGADIPIIPLGRARAGLYLLAKHARQSGRDRVVMLPYTIPDVINMIRFAGCEPVFVDTLPNSTNVDLDHLKTLIDNRTCCVLLTHYHVIQERLADIRELCRQRDVLLFDDCAISLEGDYHGARMGTITDGSVFSMSGFKTLNYVWGGAIATIHDEIGETMRREVASFPRLSSRQYGPHMLQVFKYDMATRDTLFSWITLPAMLRQAKQANSTDLLTFNRKETIVLEDTVLSRPALGALKELTRKIDNVAEKLAHRRKIAAIYDRELADWRASPDASDIVRAGSCFFSYPIIVKPEARGDILREMMRQGFHVGSSLYPNAHEIDAFKGFTGRSTNASALARSMVSLPTHPRVTVDYASALAQTLTRLLKKARTQVVTLAASCMLLGSASRGPIDILIG